MTPLPVTADDAPPRFEVRLAVDVVSPWNVWARTNNVNGQLIGRWRNGDGNLSICHNNLADRGKTWIPKTLTCAEMRDLEAPEDPGETNPNAETYEILLASCGPPCDPATDGGCFAIGCHRFEKRDAVFQIPRDVVDEYCPRTENPCGPGGCSAGGCSAGPGGSSPAAASASGPGGGWTWSGGGNGGPPPSPFLGALPGGASRTVAEKADSFPAFGRSWSHPYGERIVPRELPGHHWLVTATAVVEEYWDVDGDGVSDRTSPPDLQRRLVESPGGFELRELDGSARLFGADGRWVETRDRNGNATTTTYTGGQLVRVARPDGTSVALTYHPQGQVATMTEVGVGGGPTRTWSYTWDEERLLRIARPDGTAWRFDYASVDDRFLTRQILVGTDASERVERGYAWDGWGNVRATWRGASTFESSSAVEVHRFAYPDRPWNPREEVVTDPLGVVSTITYVREPGSNLPLVVSTSGECPSCGVGPSSQVAYGDARNPTLPTRTIDAGGVVTLLEYDAEARLVARTEAFGRALERTTTWTYDADHPAFPAAVDQPSTSGTGARRTEWVYDERGNVRLQTVEGVENGSAFSHSTVTAYNNAGQPVSVDPPGHGQDDRVVFAYDATRGGLVLASRTDPLVGTTAFEVDGWNRQVRVTDPNGVATETEYDALDRVVRVAEKGASSAEDLVTRQEYDVFGDLVRTILPRGNVLEYGYDHAGRMVEVERRADPATPGERTLYALDAYGHRIREDLQRWTGSGWETRSWTGFQYTSRCYLDRIFHADGTASEYGYDCEGNLEREWDANHPAGAERENPPTRTYGYDDLDRIAAVTEPWGGDGGGSVTVTYGYDVQDHLVRVVDGNGTVTTYTYSDRDLLTREESEVSGTTSYRYDPQGELVSSTDARGVTVDRTVDALGRVRVVDYPEAGLDVVHVYDDPAVPFSKGRLTSIRRGEASVDYRYDRFGRTTRDGDLTYAWDANGNRTEIGYPTGAVATYTHDFADREASLILDPGDGSPALPIVTAATYEPSGPLTSLALGNGLVETRTHTPRYFPEGVTVPGRLAWRYTTDAVGNPTAIVDELDAAGSRVFGYQDVQYYLTRGDGPWGDLAWTYDRLGNRLTETRDGVVTTYTYEPNAAGNAGPKLATTLEDGAAGPVRYFYDAAGNQTWKSEPAAKVRFDYASDSRLSQIRSDPAVTHLTYDGRSFLHRATRTPTTTPSTAPLVTTATYSSEGLLHARHTERPPTPSSERNTPTVAADELVLYLANRPVALHRTATETAPGEPPTESSRLLYLTTDHLGTPVLATSVGGDGEWEGGFEPFGADWQAAASDGSTENEVFLRLPGQWDDEVWSESDSTLYHNIYRWYEATLARYLRQDPVHTIGLATEYGYVSMRPLAFTDRLGLQASALPPAAGRDPFVPPIDPAFGSGPWGQRPSRQCCSRSQIFDSLASIDQQLFRLDVGLPLEGEVASFVFTGLTCYDDSWCVSFPLEGFNPPISPSITDPCVRYCIRVHEWYHHEDRRVWNINWDDDVSVRFKEGPAYQLEVHCLLSFL